MKSWEVNQASGSILFGLRSVFSRCGRMFQSSVPSQSLDVYALPVFLSFQPHVRFLHSYLPTHKSFLPCLAVTTIFFFFSFCKYSVQRLLCVRNVSSTESLAARRDGYPCLPGARSLLKGADDGPSE